MPNEDKADIPGAWRDVVYPRRHGMIAVEPAHDSGEGVGLTTMESQRVFTRARFVCHWRVRLTRSAVAGP